MPYSEQQKKAAQIALAAKKKKFPRHKLKGASLSMFRSMTIGELEDFAKSEIKKT